MNILLISFLTAATVMAVAVTVYVVFDIVAERRTKK